MPDQHITAVEGVVEEPGQSRHENAEQAPGIRTLNQGCQSIKAIAKATFVSYGLVQCFPKLAAPERFRYP